MTRPLSQHLDDVEIEALLTLRGDAEIGVTPVRLSEEAKLHLACCHECDQKIRMHRDAQNELEGLRFAQQGAAQVNCSASIDWSAVAAGLIPESEAQAHLEHASRCSACALLLKTAIAGLAGAPTPEEEDLLAGLKSNSPEWQASLARRLQREAAHASREKDSLWRRLLKPPALVFAASLSLAVAAVILIPRWNRAPSPLDLTAIAYTERRTFDLRISGAACTPKLIQRGPSSSNVDRPIALQKAEQLIHEGLLKNPGSADLLHAKGRVDLLDGSPETAIESLQRALETDPSSQTIMIDLATAFFMRAEKTGNTDDYGHAAEQLSKVLAASPNDSVSLFNRALVEDRLALYDDEAIDWKKFLQVERDPQWLAEGKARYQDAQKKLDHHAQSNWIPHRSPLFAVSYLKARARESPEASDGELDEALLSDALTQWLPSLTPAGVLKQQLSSEDINSQRDALESLADELRIRHQDTWLATLLAGPRSHAWAAAVIELSSAARANAEGEISYIIPHAVKALRLFRLSGNLAGETAAKYEYVIGVNRSAQANRCHQAALDALSPSRFGAFPWIEAQVMFEASACGFMIGRQEDALDYARKALDLARQSHYKVLELKGAFFLDGVATTSIASSDSWDRIEAGLKEFWSASYPPLLGEEFYSDLGYAAQNEGMWHCAELIFKQSLLVHSDDENQFAVASTHHRLAKAAEAAGDSALAEDEYSKADEILRKLGKATDLVRIELEIERASLEVSQNKLRVAADRLGTVESELSVISNHYALIPYYESLGDLHLNTGRSDLAEKELLEAIRLIEEDKNTLLSETDLLTWHHDTAHAYRTLLRVYAQFYHNDAKTFSLLEWYRAGPIRRVRGMDNWNPDSKFRSLSDFFRYFPQQSGRLPHLAVLTWVVFPTGLSVFLLNDSGLHSAATNVPEEVFAQAAGRFTRECADPLSDPAALDRDARQLYTWMVQPVADHLSEAQELIVEPDDSFTPIPFELLKNQQGEYLGDKLPISELPGMGYLQVLRTDNRISSQSTALVVGDPVLGSKASALLRPLPEANREAADVAADFPRHFVLTGENANLENLIRLLPQAEIFHFAGHAISEPNRTGLVLASMIKDPESPALLDEKQLHNTDLKRLKLVVLSGCSTGSAEQGLFDPGSLVRVFLRAGVPNVIASRWPVDSRSSEDLMGQVYFDLMQGASLRQALRSAEKSLRSRPQTAHPYYWAAFAVFGR